MKNNIEKAKEALYFAKLRKDYYRNERFYAGKGNEKKIIVLAGNYTQYMEYVQSTKIPASKFVYADNPSKLMGYEAEEVIETGTFSRRLDAVELRMLANSRIR